jgi:translation initiation factor 1
VSKKNKRSRRSQTHAPAEQPGDGLGGLGAALAAQGFAPSKEPDPPPPSSANGPPHALTEEAGALRGKAVVRQERKGRGGKTVTVISGPAIVRMTDLAALAKRMRKALGTGARVEDGQIVLQGDQRDVAGAWLSREGATVVLGN